MRRHLTQEDSPVSDTRAMEKIRRQRLTNIRRKRQPLALRSLAVNDDLGVPPIDVLDRKCEDLSRPQAEPREKHQDREVASPGRGSSIATAKETPDILR